MKILLSYPRLEHQRHGHWPPLGIALLGTVLRDQHGHDVKLCDTSFDTDLNRFRREFDAFQPDVFGMTLLSDFFSTGKLMSQYAKENGAITVCGGPHKTVNQKK